MTERVRYRAPGYIRTSTDAPLHLNWTEPRHRSYEPSPGGYLGHKR